MLLAGRMMMAAGAEGGPFVCTFITSAVTGDNRTTYTFAGQSLGAAASNRYIVVFASNYDTTPETLVSVTVGGINATEAASIAGKAHVSCVIAAVPTGTTGDIVVTWSGGVTRCGIGVYRLTGLNSATPTATASDATVTSDALSASLAISSGGCGIGYVLAAGDVVARTWTWTNLTENFDETVESLTTHSGAMNTASGTADRTATASGALVSDGSSLLLAAWR